MKYISLILFTVALVWTWNLVHKEPAISFVTHSGIKEKLAVLISETVKAKKPTATEVLIEKVWTETLSPEKVKAFFVYSFKEPAGEGLASSKIQGEGLLERQEDDGSGNDRWVLTKVQTSSDAIQFEEATIITGNPNAPETEEAPAPTENPEHEAEPSTESH
jgi:hypothetical protein